VGPHGAATEPTTTARALRVAIAVPNLAGGGPAVNGPLLAGFLAEHGMDVTLLVARGGPDDADEPVSPAVCPVFLHLDNLPVAARPRHALASFDFATIDVLVTNTVSELEAVIPALADGVRVIGVIREESPGEWFLLRSFAQFLDALVVVSPHMEGPVRRRLVRGPPIHVIANGLPWLERHGADRPPSLAPVRLLYAGALDAKKGVGDLPRIAAELKRRDLEFTLLVAGGDDARLHRHCARLGIDGEVKILGRVGRPALLALMATTDVFLFPSRTEAFGLALAEAMQCGNVPIAYASAGGPAGIIRNDVDGFLVATGSAAAVADRVAALVAEPARFVSLKRAARARVLSHFTLERTGERYLELVRSVCRAPPQRVPRPGVLVAAKKGLAWRMYGALPLGARLTIRAWLGRWPRLWRFAFLHLRH
jgi:glycosyltransferase involved in cell wall biosynthesis